MNDMKKKLDFKVLAIMGVVVFSACGSDSDLFNPEKAAAKKTEAMPTPTAGKQEEPLTEVKKGKAGNDKAA